jgi:hypothetical protein
VFIEELLLFAYTATNGCHDGAANLYLRLRLVFKITEGQLRLCAVHLDTPLK